MSVNLEAERNLRRGQVMIIRRHAEELAKVALAMPCDDPLREPTIRFAHETIEHVAAWERVEYGGPS